jgi:hypothetical protein
MFGLPLEVISMLASTIMGAYMKMKAQDQADKADQHRMMLERGKATERSRNSARRYDNPSAAWTRRFIVICLMTFAGLILILPVMFNLPTNVLLEYTEGFKFLFFDFTTDIKKWVPLTGVVTPDWLPYAIMNILGFYFGSAAATRPPR